MRKELIEKFRSFLQLSNLKYEEPLEGSFLIYPQSDLSVAIRFQEVCIFENWTKGMTPVKRRHVNYEELFARELKIICQDIFNAGQNP